MAFDAADAFGDMRLIPMLEVRMKAASANLPSEDDLLAYEAAVFDEEGALDKFEGFASEHGPNFYGLPLNGGTITLERGETLVPGTIGEVVPFHAGETLGWRIV